MKTTKQLGLSMLVTAMLGAQNAYAYDKLDAQNDCVNKIIHSDSRYSAPFDINVDDKGHHNYTVTGKVVDRNDKNHGFDCKIRHREVTSWNVRSASGDDDDTAAKVGAGILAVAAIAAIAASQSDDDDHAKREQTYDSGSGSSPFDDMRYLKKQCKRELRRHLRHDHGKVSRLQLSDTHLDGRELSGNGLVRFESGGERDLYYNCDFDRRGQIHDGNYHYTSSMRGDTDESAGGGPNDGIAVKDMARYCAGEASAKFGQRPRNITTQPAIKDQGMYSVFGQFPPSGADPTVFICTFTAAGELVGVDKQ